jgi:hypothetical protein
MRVKVLVKHSCRLNHKASFAAILIVLIFVKSVYYFRRVHNVVIGDYQVRKFRNVRSSKCVEHLVSRCKDFREILY